MRTFNYAIGAEITSALKREEPVHESPLYEILDKEFKTVVHGFDNTEEIRGERRGRWW
jgi:hypothetical protein